MENKTNIARLLRQIDAACARMNTGLSAFASVLAIVVLFMALIRASEITVDLGGNGTTPPAAVNISQSPTDLWTSYY